MNKQNIHLFFGEDIFQMKEKLLLWKNEFKKKYEGDLNLEVFEGKDASINDIIEAAKTIPFLAEKKLIIVNNLLKKIKENEAKKLLNFLEEGIPDHSVLLFQEEEVPDKRKSLYKKIRKMGHAHEFKYMDPAEMAQHIQKKSKGKLNYQLAAFLVAQSGGELWKAENELEKLINYADEKLISREMIEEMVIPSLSSSIFQLTDNIANKNPQKAFKILEILLDSGEDPYKILFMIVRQFRILIQVKDLMAKNYDKAQITQTLKQHPYVIMTSMNQSKNFSADELKTIYRSLLQMDIDIKSGNIRIGTNDKKEFSLHLEKFFLSCCS